MSWKVKRTIVAKLLQNNFNKITWWLAYTECQQNIEEIGEVFSEKAVPKTILETHRKAPVINAFFNELLKKVS